MEGEMTLEQAIDEFNRQAEEIRHDLWVKGEEYNDDGLLVSVVTPWAMGFSEREQEVAIG